MGTGVTRKPAQGRARARGNGTSEHTVWTPERVTAVCRRHAVGEFLVHACAAEGGTYDGLYDAMRRSDEIRSQVAKAHAEGVDFIRARMNEAGAEVDDQGRKVRYGDWKREAWWLERFDRVTFAPPTAKVEAAITNAASLVSEIAELARKADEEW